MLKRICLLVSLVLSSSVEAAFGDGLQLAQVASALTLPVAVRHAGDGSGRLFIVQQDGVIVWMDAQDVVQPVPFFQMGSVTTCAVAGIGPASFGFSGANGERGLLGLAFHPAFATNGYFFVDFTDARGDTVVARFTAVGSTTDYASCRVVIRVDQDFSNHNGGDLHFGPDGDLYIGMGDGGSGYDPCNRGQTLSPTQLAANDVNNGSCPADTNFTNLAGGNPDSRALLGKMLRIDVDQTTSAASAGGLCGKRTGGSGTDIVAFYAVPSGGARPNPFAGADGQSACDEVWAYGLRNPWRFSFDRDTGDLWIGDVGQDTTEEINFEPASAVPGRNYGWDACEGSFQTSSSSTPCPIAAAIGPVIQYPQGGSSRCSITGGFRYRGGYSAFNGTYAYGDYCTGEILLARETSASNWQSELWLDTSLWIVGFGEDEAGRIYVVSSPQTTPGTVSRIETPLLFADGFE